MFGDAVVLQLVFSGLFSCVAEKRGLVVFQFIHSPFLLLAVPLPDTILDRCASSILPMTLRDIGVSNRNDRICSRTIREPYQSASSGV